MTESKRAAAQPQLIALQTAPPAVSPAEAARIARERFGLEVRATALAGERDRNFCLTAADGRRWLLKCLDSAADEATVAAQAAILAHLAEVDPALPVPRILPALDGALLSQCRTDSGVHRTRLLTWLPGTPARQCRPGAATLRALGGMLARLDRALAGFFHPALGQALAWDVRHAPQLLPQVAAVAASDRPLVAAALERMAAHRAALRALPAQALHGDGHADNLLLAEGPGSDVCSGIIDFGDCLHGPRVLEPAVALGDFLADGVVDCAGAGALLSGYTCLQELEPEAIELLYDLVAARVALKVVVMLAQAHGRGEPAAADPGALGALARLAAAGRAALTREWHRCAGTGGIAVRANGAAAGAAARADDILARRHRALGAHAELSYERPLHLVRGAGVWLYSASGERFLDVYNNVPHVGHAHPRVVAAVSAQMRRIASNTRYLDERIIEYAEALAATLPEALAACLFVNSGSEANDIAWRIAGLATGRSGALVITHSYHGITDAVTPLSTAICPSVAPHVEEVPLPPGGQSAEQLAARARADVQAAIQRLAGRGHAPAILIIDSALTSSGIYDVPAAWAASLTEAARAAGALVIGDEVQYGLGRSGTHFWGFERRGYVPDLVTLGKPVGNGFPVGVVITRRALLEQFQKQTGFFSTFGGNPVAGAAGMAVLEVMRDEQLQENAQRAGARLHAGLAALARRHESIAAVRGAGLMAGVEMRERPGRSAGALARRTVNALRERGILIGSEGPGSRALKLRPPLPFGPEHADQVIETLDAVLTELG